MDGTAFRILKLVAASGEIPLATAIRLAKPRHKNHVDQYPLSLLIEEGYLGTTINHDSPPGFEKMREFDLAMRLHMFSLPKGDDGDVHYLGILSRGNLDPVKERVFLKAKGALYMDEHRQKLRDRFWFFVLGMLAGILTPIVSAWIRGHLNFP